MRKQLRALLLCIGGLALPHAKSAAQITMLQDYKNNSSAHIGTFQGINFREAGFSGIYPIRNSNGKEFWICSDRGVNVDCASANATATGAPCTVAPVALYDKMYCFPNYAPKIHRVRLNGDSIQILQTITVKRPNGVTTATGIINPIGLGSTANELPTTDTVLDCPNLPSKIATRDTFGIDAEGIAVDAAGYFWLSEEGGPTVWKLNQNGALMKRYTPYATFGGAQPQDVAIDTVFKYRKNNRGFEGITITPNGKIYAIIQSPLLYPNTSAGENSRVHRLLEIDPVTNATRMFAYMNDSIIGASGGNQIRLRDWKLGDLAAINDTTFLVIEAALRGSTDVKKIYKFSISGATPVHSGLYGSQTLEQLAYYTNLTANGIVPVTKTLFMDINAAGWDPALDKTECLAILNDSTIFIGNDNDYGQTCPLANGIAIATSNLSHVIKYKLNGANKLTNFVPLASTLTPGITGPSTAGTPYLVPTVPGAWFTSMLTAGENVGGYKLVGIPDGAGSYDNGDGTFTMLLNHELDITQGVTRAHGAVGSFVSKWVINKSNFSVVSGGDLMQQINLWNPATSSYITYSSAFPQPTTGLSGPFGRFCSADLPAPSAFYNSHSSKGTMNRIFMNGEEPGSNGRAVGHIASGPNMGKSYELPYLGKFAWENAVASAYESDTTIVMGMDDGAGVGQQVYMYIGTKTTTGTDVEKAGLHNGRLYGLTVTGMLFESNGSVPAPGTPFTMTDMGFVHNMRSGQLDTSSGIAGITSFLRPEDGAWDPKNPNDFYFVTTNGATSPSRLWRARFTNIATPTLGGTITAVLDGTEGQKMLDNITVDNYGHVLMVEDIGNNAHVGKIWQYTIATDNMKMIASCDSTRFLAGAANFLTQDEEASGIVDAEHILGPGMFLTVVQSHHTAGVSADVVQGGQMLAFFNPDTYNSAPEVDVTGSGVSIVDGDATPSAADNTNFGNVNTGASTSKAFVIHNTGAGGLNVTGISLTGAAAGDFAITGMPSFPLGIAAGGSYTLNVTFTPAAAGTRNATITLMNNDAFEGTYDFALVGTGVEVPEIVMEGNGANIIDGDATPGAANNTDFGDVNVGASVDKAFVIKNTGAGNLSVTGVTFTGANAADFALVSAPTFPLTIATAGSFTVTAKFTAGAAGARNATMNIANTDTDEATFDFAVKGNGVVPSTGVAAVSEAYSLKVYPNPAGDAATIALTMKNAGNVEISVCDVQGKQVLPSISKKVAAGEHMIELNTATLANGVYFLKVADGTSSTNIRMVVMH